jgi:diguanylate cyclase (GGDEF)-like protein/PAS domain S-box-containing protein
VTVIREEQLRRVADRDRELSGIRFRAAFESTLSPMIFTDIDDRVIEVNDSFCRMIGRTRQQVLGRDSKPFTYPEDVGIAEESVRQIAGGSIVDDFYVKRYLHTDGRVVVVEVARSTAYDEAGEFLCYVISERDITERVRRDKLLLLLAEVNKLAIAAQNEDDFFSQLCDVIVAVGGYALAWIGVSSTSAEGGIDLVCASGSTDYLYGDMTSWWGAKESLAGPSAIALHTGETQIINDLVHHAVNDAWRDHAIEYGFGSMVAVPELFGDRRASLVMYHRDAYAFDDTTVTGLTEIVRATQFAITHVRSTHETAEALEAAIDANEHLRVTERALTQSEQRFRVAFEDNMAPMIFSDQNDLAIAVNDAFCDMVGFTREELLGQNSIHFTYPEDVGITESTHSRLVSDELEQVRYVKRYLRKDGRVIVAEVSRSTARDDNGKTLYLLSSERDITEERALADQLSHRALHDPLTGLANRVLFDDRLSQAHARIVRQGGLGAVLLMDLDDFKGVNDTHGHFVGDQLLEGIARRLELVTRSTDTLCRFGGDEFLYLAEGLTSPSEAVDVAHRLLAALAEPFVFGELRVEPRASVGIVILDSESIDDTDFVQNADVALYEAKRQHRGNCALFTRDLHQRAASRFELTQELRHAVQAGELSMHYQPIVDLATSDVVGFEALMRWHHPVRGWVPPNVFIPLAEQSDLIVELGAFALDEAVTAAHSWQRTSATSDLPFVTVNLSAHQFHYPGLVPTIELALSRSGLAPDRLILEVTESVALLNITETLEVMAHLNALGINIALDDFGTGYSSLAYLTQLNPRIIKIDQSFVSPTLETHQNDSLLEAIVSLGKKLKMTLLAEGIESSAQLSRLRNLDCELGQGYLFSPAVPFDETAAMLSRAFCV